MAIKSFKNKATEEINYGIVSKQTRKLLPVELHEKAKIKLARVAAATILQDFQELKGNKKDQCSIQINDQFRICFKWDGKDAIDVEIVDYH